MSARSDQNANGCIGVKIEHENQVRRPSIRVYGRVVSKTDHKICDLPTYREARGHDAQAPIAELGEKNMHMTSKKTSKSGPKADAELDEGMWWGLKLRSDESTIWTPNGVIKAKTVRTLPEDQRWYRDDVLNIRGVP